MTTSAFNTPPIEVNAVCLYNQINEVYTRSSYQRVVLIAHSMGGLVSRVVLEANPNQYNLVSTLITLGSPHKGVPQSTLLWLLPLCGGDIGGCEFSEPWVKLVFNRKYSVRNPQVNYYVVGGTAENLFWRLKSFNGDGIIPQDSAATLPGNNVKHYKTDRESHTDFYGYPTYMQQAQGDTSTQGTSFKCVIRPALYSGVTPPSDCPTITSPLQTTDTFTSLNQSPLISNTLSAIQVVTHPVLVDSNGLSLFNLSYITGTLNFNLVSPTGQVVTPGYAQANPAVVLYSSAPISSPFGAIASYAFTTTTPGTWSLQVSNLGPVSPVSYRAQVSFESALTVTATLDKELYPVGSTVQMTAAISSSVPITGLQASALIHLPSGATNAISLTVANPQTLTGAYVVPATKAGYVLVQIQISGFANGTPFAREADAEFLIPTNGAKLAGVYTDRPTDFTAPLYQTLSFDARISVTTPATYTLSADLMVGSQIIAHSQTQSFLASGTPTVTIKFSGDAIRVSQINGPYVVSNVVLVDSSSYTLLADSANSVWTTPAYSYTQFGTPVNLYLPLILKNP